MEREFNVGDRVRVVKATLAATDEHVGMSGVVVQKLSYSNVVRVDVGSDWNYWHRLDGLELIESEQTNG